MTDASDNPAGLSPDLLERAHRRLGDGLEEGRAPEDRRLYLEGLRQLGDGDLEAAHATFRRGCREAAPPFDTLCRVARGECERLRGHHGAALRQWRRVTDDADAPPAARYMAWMSIAARAESRGDQQLLSEATGALDDLRVPDRT